MPEHRCVNVSLLEAAGLMRICRREGIRPPVANGWRRPYALGIRCQGAVENE
jgi:hypothetical protein